RPVFGPVLLALGALLLCVAAYVLPVLGALAAVLARVFGPIAAVLVHVLAVILPVLARILAGIVVVVPRVVVHVAAAVPAVWTVVIVVVHGRADRDAGGESDEPGGNRGIRRGALLHNHGGGGRRRVDHRRVVLWNVDDLRIGRLDHDDVLAARRRL